MLIGHDLLEAYRGVFEDEIEHDCVIMKLNTADEWVMAKIESHTPKERLEVYLTWNGIIGFTSRIYELATGEF